MIASSTRSRAGNHSIGHLGIKHHVSIYIYSFLVSHFARPIFFLQLCGHTKRYTPHRCQASSSDPIMDNDLSEVMVDYECGRVAVQIIVQRLCRLERDHDHLTGSGSQFAASWIAVIMLKTSVRMCTAQAYSLASLVREYWAERYRAFCLNLVFTPSLGLPEFDDGIDNLAKMSMKHFRDLLNRVVTISIRQLEISGTIAEVRYIEQQLESACFSMQWYLRRLSAP